MLAISLAFPAKRFHATPWGRQVNEGAVEWPPSPWRLLRALIAVWHHKFPDVPETEIRDLIERLTPPPRFHLPPASQGHTRHYMPLVNGDRTKIFDTFIAVEPGDAVIAVWPEVEITVTQRKLLRRLLQAMTYFGRAESWVCGDLLDTIPDTANVCPLELGVEPPLGSELVPTLIPVQAEQHVDWFTETREQHRRHRLDELIAVAQAKGKSTEKVKLAKKDELTIEESLPATLFDALHADTSALRKAGWNQPPGSRWINYARPSRAFANPAMRRHQVVRDENRPTVARFAVCGSVRPLLTEAVLLGERVRIALMGCSKAVRNGKNAAPVFSGKQSDGTPLGTGHRHAHFLSESVAGDGRISHLTVFASMGFDVEDELAFGRLAKCRVVGKGGYNLQLVLLGVGRPEEFGGLNDKAGASRILHTSGSWVSRTPFLLTRHLSRNSNPSREAIAVNPQLQAKLIQLVRFELRHRDQFGSFADQTEIEPILTLDESGTRLGGRFTSWIKFRRERLTGGGRHAGPNGYGLRLTFPEPVAGPVALGYGCHFGLGQFVPVA